MAAGKATMLNAATPLSYTSIAVPIESVTAIRRVDISKNIVQPSTSTPIVTIAQIA